MAWWREDFPRRPGRSASTRASDSSDLMPSARTFRVLSYAKYTFPAVMLLGRLTDRQDVPHSGMVMLAEGTLESTFILHLLRLIGVGRVSEPALTRKENCPAGRPA